MNTLRFVAMIVSALALLFSPKSIAAPGDLDASFGNGGKVTTAIGSGDDIGRSMLVQIDGKIVVAGYSYDGTKYDFALIRYNTDGSLDTTFNGTGKVTTAISNGDDEAYGLAIQPDGKIVAVGYSYNGTYSGMTLVRYNTNGSLDTTFGGSGKVTTTPFGTGLDAVVDKSGRIVVTGSAGAFMTLRYNGDGTLDTAFNGTGSVFNLIQLSSMSSSVAIQNDGKIVTAGFSIVGGFGAEFALARYNANGTLDTSFNGTGLVITNIGSSAQASGIAIQGNGKIVVAGSSFNGSYQKFALVRYNSDGSLDTFFNGTGKVTTSIGSGNDVGQSVALQSDGKILVGGTSFNGSNNDFAVVRYNADGSLDTSFNRTGQVTTSIGSGDDVAYSIALQSDGRILAAGYSFNGSNNDFALTRYVGGPYASPTLAELATLSNNVYTANAGIDAYQYQGDNTTFIPNDNFMDVGFRAAVYATPDKSEVVIAFRGTVIIPPTMTTLKNVAADFGFGGSTPSPRLVNYAAAAADMLEAVAVQYPTANITLTGHSLGGSLAQVTGAASGLSALAFNAPGAGNVYESLLNSSLGSVVGLGSGGTNLNCRIYGDQVSLFGAPMPNSATVTLPWPVNVFWVPFFNPYDEAMINMATILNLHDPSTVVAQINSQPVASTGQPNDATALQNWVQGTVQGALTYNFLFTVASVLDVLVDPSGADIVFDEQTGAPAIASIDLPTLPGIAWYDVQYQVGGAWSSFSLVDPGGVYQLGPGTTGVGVIPLDINGNAVSLSDFLFDLDFSATGTVSAGLTTSPTAAPLPPFQAWQIANFGSNGSKAIIGSESANPSGDGVVNLMKYALCMNPNVNSLVGLPVGGATTVSGTTYLTLTYGKNDSASDITYHPEWSTDLSTWSNMQLIEKVLSDDGTIQHVQDSIPLNSTQTMFIRLRVTRP